MNRREKIKLIVTLAIAISLLAAVIVNIVNKDDEKATLSYNEVISEIERGNVKKITSRGESKVIELEMRDGTTKNALIPDISGFYVLVSDEIKSGKDIEISVESSSETNITMVMSIIQLAFLIYLLRSMTKRLSGEGNFNTKPHNSTTRFTDVAGIDEEKEQLQEIVEFLKHPETYENCGARIPKGVILSGDPGTGKTLLAKAIAGEAGVPFFNASGSEFEEKFVGVGASRMRKLFDAAKKNAPAIIFIDEIDTIAQNRYSGKSYSEQTLNQLLTEMDGFETNSQVIVIAATNHIEVLDPAILRPGRFDRKIFVPKPDVAAREAILHVHARGKAIDYEEVSLRAIAKRTTGFCGADLENVLNEAAIIAVNNQRVIIKMADIEEAIARILVGLKKEHVEISPKELEITATHEAGHAVVSHIVRPDVKNLGISIVPRGKAGGYNMFDEQDGMYVMKKDLTNRILVAYGGRAAEEVILNDISTGASGDCEQASKIAFMMLTRFSMNGTMLSKISGESTYNNQLDVTVMGDAEELCKENYKKALEIVKENKDTIVKLAKLLMEKEYLTQSEVEQFMEKNINNS